MKKLYYLKKLYHFKFLIKQYIVISIEIYTHEEGLSFTPTIIHLIIKINVLFLKLYIYMATSLKLQYPIY